MTRIVERSADNGATWERWTCSPRSQLAIELGGLAPYEVLDDGPLNLYRWRPAEEAGAQ